MHLVKQITPWGPLQSNPSGNSQRGGWLQNHRIRSQRGTFLALSTSHLPAKAALVYKKQFLNAKFGNSTYSSNPLALSRTGLL